MHFHNDSFAHDSLSPRVETICEAGFGGEARVFLQLRNVFPGPGGVVKTDQDIAVGFRVPNGVDTDGILDAGDVQFQIEDIRSKRAFILFLKNAVLKKLDDYFFRSDVYKYPHIPRPLGCTPDGAHVYEWVFGIESIPLTFHDYQYDIEIPLSLDEESLAGAYFLKAGIDITRDTVESEQLYRKNIIVEESGLPNLPSKVSCLWKRIDFGNSIGFDFDRLSEFLEKEKEKLIAHLGADRFEMLSVSSEFLSSPSDPQFPKMERLFELLWDYRLRTAHHMGVESISPLDQRKAPEVLVLDPEDELVHEHPIVIRDFRTKDDSVLSYEIRREFPSIDGTIFTHQYLAVARITRPLDMEVERGFELFLRHFLVKKLENAFNSMGRYCFPHISRPLGSEGKSYLYEWTEGEALCPRSLLEIDPARNTAHLADWTRFVAAFRDAGVDMEHGLRWISDSHFSNVEFAKQIIIRQPGLPSETADISRLWGRVNFHENSVSIDYEKLKTYLITNMDQFLLHLSPGRFETMLLAINYLSGASTPEGLRKLCQGVQNYRRSALRHLNYRGFSR